MINELLLLMIPVSMILLSCKAIFTEIKNNNQKNIIMHDAVNQFFFKNKCLVNVRCTQDAIILDDKYQIKIRKPAKPFGQKQKQETKDEELENLYSRLEEAITNSTKQ